MNQEEPGPDFSLHPYAFALGGLGVLGGSNPGSEARLVGRD
jgi:hypothetical protein